MKINSNIKYLKNKSLIWSGIKLTKEAARQINYIISRNNDIKGIRLSVKSSGCAGYSYNMKPIKCIKKNDLVYYHNGANLYVDICSMPYIDGTEIDYIEDGLNQMFKFNNPKSKNFCGCGESFSIK